MKVLLVNTSDNTGGAAVAANRLMEALRNNGVEVSMLVRDKGTDSPYISKVRGPWWKRMLDCVTPQGSWCKAMERVMLLPYAGFSWKRAWGIDANILGTDITKTKEFKEADVIHLHWVNQGMLSLNDLRKIFESGKRVVWTMHDLWAATGVCHYSHECSKFQVSSSKVSEFQVPSSKVSEFQSSKVSEFQVPSSKFQVPKSKGYGSCMECSFLPKGSKYAMQTWKKKYELYHSLQQGNRPTFVACSEWLANQARKSSLMEGMEVISIPNPIDTNLYKRNDKAVARKALDLPLETKIILFVSQKVTDERKGAKFFIDAVNSMTQKENLAVAILGGHSEEIAEQLQCKSFSLGYITDQQKIVSVYNSADCFVLPSLQDNLPNTIMEAMACGVPCVGFDIGGIPEMIDHERNGIICEPRNIEALKQGITYCLSPENHQRLSDDCLRKVNEAYSQNAVAERFIEVYGSGLVEPILS